MPQSIKTLLFSVVIFYSTNLFSQNLSQQNKTLDVESFDQKIQNSNSQLIDVRTPEEYKKGHLESALNVDWNSKEFDTMIEALDKNRPVYVYCLSGARSLSAAEKMKSAGFKEIYQMEGGILAWQKADKATVTLQKSSMPEMSLEEYNEKVKSDKLVLVDFNAPWCAPCKKMAPMIEELSKSEKERLEIVKINIEDEKSLAKILDVHILPTMLLYKNEQVVWKHEGLISKEQLLEKIYGK